MAFASTRRDGARVLTNVLESEGIVGRTLDRAAIASLFNEEARLVTIVGPGGMGKTRLATCFAREQIEAYSAPGDGGVWLVDLTSAVSVAGLCAALASTLGVKLTATQDEPALVQQIGTTLQRRGRILIVLDNFEALIPHAASTLGALLRLAPRARWLVTSRIALDLAAEHRWLLNGLGLPPPVSDRAALSLLQVESVDLFLRRARQVRPDLEVDDDVVRCVAAIAAQLEGIPLALELAAARVAVISPAQLNELLAAGREDILVRSREDGRHGSMRTVVLDSLRLLEADEQRALTACAVFDGGFDLAAAAAVVGGGASVLGVLERLVAHSLVQVGGGKGARVFAGRRESPGSTPRFSIYAVIREVAELELERDPSWGEEVRSRHAQYFATLASNRGAATSLRAEQLNLVRAHATVMSESARQRSVTERAAAALALALAIEAVVDRGDLALRLEVLGATLDLVRDAEALNARGRIHAALGAFDTALRDFDEALSLAVSGAQRDAEAAVRIELGILVEARGDTSAAREHFTAALAVTTTAHDRESKAREAQARAALAHALRREGRLAEADVQIVASIEIHRALGNQDGLCSAVFEAGVLSLFRQAYASADDRFGEALVLARRLGARQREAAIMTAQGTMEQERENVQDARELHEAAVAIFRDAGNVYAEASTLYYLGGAYLEAGQSDDAEALLAHALGLVRSVGVPRYEALISSARAALHAMSGHLHEAEALLDAAMRAASKCATEPTLSATLAIHRLHLTLVSSLGTVDATAIRDEARGIAAAHACDDPRFALRLLCRSSSQASEELPVLLVLEGGKAFHVPGAPAEVDLRRRVPLARILDALARRRVEAPGDPMRVDDILAAGWPEERVRYDAGANRVYVALAELRKLGLRDWIVSDASGYRLATSRRVLRKADRD